MSCRAKGISIVFLSFLSVLSVVFGPAPGAAASPGAGCAPDSSDGAYGRWSVQNQGMATYLSGVCFADNGYGWAVGGIDGVGPSIHFTGDGGAHWTVQSTVMYNLMYLGCDCSDRQNVFVVGVQFLYPGLVLSHNGGETWETRSMPGLVWSSQSVEAVDAKHIKIPSTWTTLLHGERKGITLSDDGGATWKGYDWGVATYPRYAFFLDANRGWMTGGTWPDEGKGDGPPPFRLTRHSPPIGGLPAAAGGSGRGTRYEAAVARTLDGGRTWQLLYFDVDRFYLNRICMIDEDEGWCVGEADYTPFILHTTDGWRTVEFQDPPAGSYGLTAVDMIDRNEGFAVGFGPGGFDVTMVCLHTLDGGRTWTLDKPGIKTGAIDTAFHGRNSGWAVGGNNMQVSTVARYANDSNLDVAVANAPLQAAPGDTISWDASVANRSTGPLTFDVWLGIESPSLPPQVNPLLDLLYGNITFPGGFSAGGTLHFTFPAVTPPGTYTFTTAAGHYPAGVVDSDLFVINVD